MVCATLLTADEVVVENVPDIVDVNQLIALLRDMGVRVEHRSEGVYAFCAAQVNLDFLCSEDFMLRCSRLRGSVMLVGPLLARFGRALISRPGGDRIGRRRLDTHFRGLEMLGASFSYDACRGCMRCRLRRD